VNARFASQNFEATGPGHGHGHVVGRQDGTDAGLAFALLDKHDEHTNPNATIDGFGGGGAGGGAARRLRGRQHVGPVQMVQSTLARDLSPAVPAADATQPARDNQAFAVDLYQQNAGQRAGDGGNQLDLDAKGSDGGSRN
jgi:hypothetical protein